MTKETKPVHQRLYDLISQDEKLLKEIRSESENATVCEEYFDNDTTFNEINCDEYKNNQDNEVICEKYDGDGLNVNGLTHNEIIEIDKLWENEPGFKRYEEEIFPLSKELGKLLGSIITVYAKPGQFVSCGIYDALKLPEDISFSYSLSCQNERFIEINRLIYRNGAVNVTYLYESNSNSNGNGRFKVCSRLNLPTYLL